MGAIPSPLLSLQGPSPSPSMGFLFLFIIDSCSWSSVHPSYPTLPLHLTWVLHSRHSVAFINCRRWAFQALCEVPFHLGYVVLSGNTAVSNFTTTSSFRIQKSISHGHSSQLSQVFGLVLFTSTSLVFVLLLGYSYTITPAGTLLPLHRLALYCSIYFGLGPYCFPPPSGQPSIAIQIHASVTPVLLAVANAVWLSHWGPLFDVLSTLHSQPASGYCFDPWHRSVAQAHTFFS